MMFDRIEPASRLAHEAIRIDTRRRVDIWSLLVWAFQREAAQLDFSTTSDDFTGFGYASMTAMIAEHEQLGCRIDGGGRSDPHPDADLVADALSVLSQGCGGERMALMIAEHARAGVLPDWNVATSIQPREWSSNQSGSRASTADAADLGASGWPHQDRINRKGVTVKDMVRYCPVIVHGGVAEVAYRRRQWLLFRLALLELRASFQYGGDLTSWFVTDQMPEARPWLV